MVHVRKCPCRHGRGIPVTEFYKDGKPQIYCYGWIDDMKTNETIQICKDCPDWVKGEQCRKDFEEWKGGTE